MKYTRYDLKKRKSDSLTLIVMLLSVILVAFLLGTGLASIFIKENKQIKQVANNEAPAVTTPIDKNPQVKPENSIVKYICIQSGYFEKKNYAEELRIKLMNVVNPFTVVEGDKVRVMAGIFNEEEGAKIIQTLNEKVLPNSKNNFEINKSSLCDAEIAEIINGNIKILSKLLEKDVTAVQTETFKVWVKSLQDPDPKHKDYNTLQELKKYILSLPKELSKENTEGNYIFIYNTLKNVTGK